MEWSFNFKYFAAFAAAFVAFTIIGTVSHELGHYSIGKILGYDCSLSYNSVQCFDLGLHQEINHFYEQFGEEIKSGKSFPGEEQYDALQFKLRTEHRYIIMGGIGQTLLTGTLGLLILIIRRKRQRQHGFTAVDMLAVFLSLFWLRQVFNLLSGLAQGLLLNKGRYFGGDERNLARALHWPEGSLAISLGLIGFAVGLYVVFIVLPKKYQIPFIAGGLFGGLAGFYLWMKIAGPVILP